MNMLYYTTLTQIIIRMPFASLDIKSLNSITHLSNYSTLIIRNIF